MSLRLYGTISGWGRSAGAVIPALGSGRYSPGPNIVLPSWRKGSDPHFTTNVFWGQPGALATVSHFTGFSDGGNKYPPAKPEVLRLLAPQRGLTAIAKSKPKTVKTTNGRLPELSNFGSPPAEPGVYHD